MNKQGFTLVEMLVASLLMGMLVTILTMVFNASSIAWRTGKASIADLDDTRRQLANSQYASENALPRLKDASDTSSRFRIASAWNNGLVLRDTRAIEPFSDSNVDLTKPFNANVTISASSTAGSTSTYIVGVKSLGPDKNDPADDITTWPEKK